MNFNDVALNMQNETNSFKKIQYFSKTNAQSLFTNSSEYKSRYLKLSNLYFNDIESTKSFSYGTKRQHNYASLKAVNNNFYSKMENNAVDKFVDYNTAKDINKKSKYNNVFSDFNLLSEYTPENKLSSSLRLHELLTSVSTAYNFSSQRSLINEFMKYTDRSSILLESINNAKQKKSKVLLNGSVSNIDVYTKNTDLSYNNPLFKTTSQIQNKSFNYRAKKFKPANLNSPSIPESNQNVRFIDNSNVKRAVSKDKKFSFVTENKFKFKLVSKSSSWYGKSCNKLA